MIHNTPSARWFTSLCLCYINHINTWTENLFPHAASRRQKNELPIQSKPLMVNSLCLWTNQTVRIRNKVPVLSISKFHLQCLRIFCGILLKVLVFFYVPLVWILSTLVRTVWRNPTSTPKEVLGDTCFPPRFTIILPHKSSPPPLAPLGCSDFALMSRFTSPKTLCYLPFVKEVGWCGTDGPFPSPSYYTPSLP